jgi:hypothetical protein
LDSLEGRILPLWLGRGPLHSLYVPHTAVCRHFCPSDAGSGYRLELDAPRLAHKFGMSGASFAYFYFLLLDYLIKQYVEEVCDNINKRYRTAQRAGVPLPLCTQLFYFQDKVSPCAFSTLKGSLVDIILQVVEEEAYVIKVCNNAVVLIVPKYGIEVRT